MALAYVNTGSGNADPSATTIATAATSLTAGNLIVVWIAWGGSTTVSSIADTAGNTYVQCTGSAGSNTDKTDMWYAKNTLGNASNIVTVTFSAGSTFRRVITNQYSGASTTAPFVAGATGAITTGTTVTTGTSMTTTNADAVIVAGVVANNAQTYTAGTNFTLRGSTVASDSRTEDRIVSATGSYTASMSGNASGRFTMSAAAFQAGGTVLTKTQTGTARISSAVTKTQPATGRITATVTKTQASVARVSKSFTLTQPATARVSKAGITKTQPSIARISATVTKTQSAIARISKSLTATQQANARVSKSLTFTQTATASIVAGTTSTKTQTSTARISNTASLTQTATARLAKSFTKTQPATARLAKPLTLTQGATARVSKSLTKTQLATSRISSTLTKTQSAVARIAGGAQTLSYTQTATASIASTRTPEIILLTDGRLAKRLNNKLYMPL